MMLVGSLVFPNESASISITSIVAAQTQFSVWTDESEYSVGAAVAIHVSPVPAIGVSFWLTVWKPDGSQLRIDLSPGQDTAMMIAEEVGDYMVELWGQAVAANPTPELLATCYFSATAPLQVLYRGTVHYVPSPGRYEVIIQEIVQDPTRQLKAGDFTGVSVYGQGQIIGDIQVGSYVEVYGEYAGLSAGFQQVNAYRSYHYIRLLTPSIDLVIIQCWVDPQSPKEGDSVTFYKTIANRGTSDADNVLVEAYLDNSLYYSDRGLFKAGDTHTGHAPPWTATTGSHTVRWVVNFDRSVLESDYSNNEASCSFEIGAGKLPDLTVYGLRMSPGNPNSDDEVTFYATIANQGYAPACGPYWRITLDGATLGELGTYVCAEPGWTLDVSYPEWTAVQGSHEVCWIVDPTNAIAESNEDNNSACMRFTVGTKPPPPPQVDVWTDKGGGGLNIPDGSYDVRDTVRIVYSVDKYVAFASLTFSGPRKFTNNLGSQQAGKYSYDFQTKDEDAGRWAVTFLVCASGDPGMGLCDSRTMAKDTVAFDVQKPEESLERAIAIWDQITLYDAFAQSQTEGGGPTEVCKSLDGSSVWSSCFSVQQNYWIYNSQNAGVFWAQNVIHVAELSEGHYAATYTFVVFDRNDMENPLRCERPLSLDCRFLFFLTDVSFPMTFTLHSSISFENGDYKLGMRNELGRFEFLLPNNANCPCYIQVTRFGSPIANFVVVGAASSEAALFERMRASYAPGYVQSPDESCHGVSFTVIHRKETTGESSKNVIWDDNTRSINLDNTKTDQGVYFARIDAQSKACPSLPQSAVRILFDMALDPPDALAHILVTDAQGRASGYDVQGTPRNEIPNSFVYRGAGGEHVVLVDPISTYQVTVTGVSSGNYRLSLTKQTNLGEVVTKSFEAGIDAGESQQFQLEMNTVTLNRTAGETNERKSYTWILAAAVVLTVILTAGQLYRRNKASGESPRILAVERRPKITDVRNKETQ